MSLTGLGVAVSPFALEHAGTADTGVAGHGDGQLVADQAERLPVHDERHS
jgi:hypothetical protein